jgi:uncharacterized membrane-anchored protein
MTTATHASPRTRALVNKVPEVTVYFWIIKVLCTTVGESAADYLNETLGFGLNGTIAVMSVLLAAAIAAQIRARSYIPAIYWVTVVLISIVGTLITDELSDGFGVSLVLSTPAFAVVLAATFGFWYASEHTLSIHTVHTARREGFYWAAILFTFALGTAAGDLVAERFGLGYWVSAILFAAVIAVIAAIRFGLQANAIISFWLAYIMTRPLGASIGDYLSQAKADGGFGLGTVATSGLFLTAILALVVYLTITKRDQSPTGQR